MTKALFSTIVHTLTAAVADAGTFTLTYPSDDNGDTLTPGHFQAHGHEMNYAGGMLYAPADFTVSFGASSITVTNATGGALAANEEVIVTLMRAGDSSGEETVDGVVVQSTVRISLGAPDTADADGVCASQAGTASTAMTINGALASGGVATFDVPRNVVGAWTNTATLTVTGTDVYGATVVETSGSGTSMAGKKAFKTITSVVPSANITGATVGSGDVLGLPIFVAGTADIVSEGEDGAAATAGTLVGGATAEATATTGDVRGTYDPNSACDGAKAFDVKVAVDDATYKGVAQFGG